MGEGVARFVLTDAPLDVAGGDATGGEADELEKASGADARTDGVLLEANRTWIEAVLPYLVDGGLLGTFIDWRGLPIVHASAGVGLDASRSGRLGKSQCGSGQSLPLPA